MSLTRAQAATVLCRLIDKSARVNVIEEEQDVELPQEDDNKYSDVTWDDFCAMTEEEIQEFIASFENYADFEKWLERMQKDTPENDAKYPWEEPGAKQPKDYTWDEFSSLNEEQMDAFIASFESSAAFERWAEKVQNAGPGYQYPWEKAGAKQPNDYTWDEFSDLSDDEMAAFMDWFGSEESFEAWLEKVA